MTSGLLLKIVKLLVLCGAFIVLTTMLWQLKLTTLTTKEQLPTSNVSIMYNGGATDFLQFFEESRRDIFPLTISPDPYRINNNHVCMTDKDVDLMVLVISAAPYVHKRRVIRCTWGNITQYHSHRVRLVFLLGLSHNASVTADIIKENAVHNDIVQGNFIDSYFNLTHKAVMGLRWTSENCPHARLVVKADDDTYINVFKLLEDIDGEYKNKSKEILCDALTAGSSPVQRSVSSKWRLSEEFFPNNICFPFSHCRGFFVIFTPDIITPLYETATKAPFLWLDDVYLTGMLPAILGGIKVTPLDNLVFRRESDAVKCFKSISSRCDVRGVLTQQPYTIESLWNDTLNNQNLPSNSSRISVRAEFYGTDLICRTHLIYYLSQLLVSFALVYMGLTIASQTYSHRRFLQNLKFKYRLY